MMCMKKLLFRVAAFIAALVFGVASVMNVPDVEASGRKPSVKPQQLVGNWYMGTMSGVDCNLRIRADKTLTVQTGGCFHQDPAVRSKWLLRGNRILLGNPALNDSLGSHLRVVRYKNNIVLVPQRTPTTGSHPYSYHQTFWKNTMKNGLQLSAAAYEASGQKR
jgi:hypothetical protein